MSFPGSIFFIAFSFVSLNLFAQYPDNIYPDTAYTPFYYGVASGDPLKDRVIIWTKVHVTDNTVNRVPLRWEVSKEKDFTTLVNKGEAAALRARDFTVKVDVTGLSADERYFYRFITAEGKISQMGTAKTLPPDTVKQFKLAVVSCSSIWSGYFNAYRQISQRSDLDFVIHLGDYVYDYPDENEYFRMPEAVQKDVANLDEWRERHTYYLLDPDLRAVRQNKTFIAEWDNHDTNVEAPGKEEEAIQAFYEYLPIRIPDTLNPQNIYRVFPFGNLADLIMIDMQLFRGKEEYIPGKRCVLGNLQDAWLKKELLKSTATWKLIGNQEMMGSWRKDGAPGFLPIPGDEKYFDPGCWDGFPDDRNRLFSFIDSNNINNFVVMTGDIHMAFVIDLTQEPKDKERYDPKTGNGAVGVEFTVPSVSRGNFDEAGIPRSMVPIAQRFSRSLNPHHVWCQFSKHGYATLDVTAERCELEFWFVEILKKSDKEEFGRRFVVKNGVNHWERESSRREKRSAD